MDLKFMVKSTLLGHDWDSQVKEGCGQGSIHPLVDRLGAELTDLQTVKHP